MISLSKHTARGFTLIELMIVVAIIAILAAIAYPSYQEYVRKTYRGTAKSCLLEYAAAMERYYSSNMKYTDAAPDLACATESNLNSRYTIAVTTQADKPNEFSVKATPQGAQLKDTACGTLTVDQTGNRTATGNAPTTCW